MERLSSEEPRDGEEDEKEELFGRSRGNGTLSESPNVLIGVNESTTAAPPPAAAVPEGGGRGRDGATLW